MGTSCLSVLLGHKVFSDKLHWKTNMIACWFCGKV
uniref:Uncharacterized protein n=1 Tax=Anguilla anguilla TaxID=7936 RepID=A0A0E9V9N3_ANGAN